MAISLPKSMFGNLLGASGSVDVAAACISMSGGEVPLWTGCDEPEPGWGWAAGKGGGTDKDVTCAMVNSVGRGGINACVILRKAS